uniref:Uncharacterized protein n=1 Tax=Arundo donax TaxID=35708 RepID=A0A0A9FRS7_ARUDO
MTTFDSLGYTLCRIEISFFLFIVLLLLWFAHSSILLYGFFVVTLPVSIDPLPFVIFFQSKVLFFSILVLELMLKMVLLNASIAI